MSQKLSRPDVPWAVFLDRQTGHWVPEGNQAQLSRSRTRGQGGEGRTLHAGLRPAACLGALRPTHIRGHSHREAFSGPCLTVNSSPRSWPRALPRRLLVSTLKERVTTTVISLCQEQAAARLPLCVPAAAPSRASSCAHCCSPLPLPRPGSLGPIRIASPGLSKTVLCLYETAEPA